MFFTIIYDKVVIMDVSIVLVNYNTKDLTLKCLESIYEKTSGIEFDVFVIDNASADGSSQAIKENFSQVILIENKENLGFGRANNIGIKNSKAKYVLFLNTDTILINNAVKVLFDLLESDTKIAACGGNLFAEDGSYVHSFGYLNSPKRQLLRIFGLRYLLKDSKNNVERKSLQEVEQVIGADLMIRKSVLDEVGLFSEKFFLYFEESELQFRIRKAGYKIFYSPEAKLIHTEGGSTKKDKKLRRQMIAQSEYLYLLLCYTNHPKLYLRLLCTIPQLYRFFNAPKNTYKALKYIWQN